MKFVFTPVFNRGAATPEFIHELVVWAKTADDSIFAKSPDADIYGKVNSQLGPFTDDITHRKAVMLEVMRVLALFESGDSNNAWNCGVDTTRASKTDNENAEAGRWQVSYDSRNIHPSLRRILAEHDIHNGYTFQSRMKSNHTLAMTYVATLMRHNTKHNGPLYKGVERLELRESVQGVKHSIYPYLSRWSVDEFESLLKA